MGAGKSGLSASGRTDQHNQRQLGNGDLHKLKTPICVGGPSCGSSSPTGRCCTVYPKRCTISCDQFLNSERVHSKRWSLWRNVPAGKVSNFELYSAFGVVTTTVFGRASA